MSKKYVFNPRTLSYEISVMSTKNRVLRSVGFFVLSLLMASFYFWIYVYVLEWELPKTAWLKKENANLISKINLLDKELDACESELSVLQMRDDNIYRSIFGLNTISSDVRNAGFGGVNRYEWLNSFEYDESFGNTVRRLDRLSKMSYVQSKSFDEVSGLSKRAGDMASCIPAIPPINPVKGKFRLSSRYGYRVDPKYGGVARHTGIDLATNSGNPIYATGDGVVESVKFELFGYGNQVIINHGFGYKTRYAHMSLITVSEGMKLKRGECIGAVGNSGKSTGPHLHYEVIYKGGHTNPMNYLDLDMPTEEYASMVKITEDMSDKITIHPSHRKRKKK